MGFLVGLFFGFYGYNFVDSTLISYEYKTLSIDDIIPHGWFATQLNIQANGLSGHLQHFWPDIENSIWIGGNADTGLHERTPYWLNGVVPLSFLVDNEGLKNDVEYYMNYIMDHQQQNGWLGPNGSGGDQYWAAYNILQALSMYADGIEKTNVTLANRMKTVMLNYILEQQRRMSTTPTTSWSAARYMDFVLSCQYLLENGGNIINGYEQNLEDVILLAYKQGFLWENWFDFKETPSGVFPTEAVLPTQENLYNHGVNNAQAFKSAAVMYRSTNNITLKELSKTRMYNMDKYHGQPTGMFSCDEHLAGLVPSRGTETCTVVEYMYSYQVMFKTFGDIEYLDKLERIAYNALPATFGSPKGGDMWNHQYLQQNNELNAMYTDPHIWATDGPNSTVYGLAPNYGCCTANFNQGWPKFAYSIFYRMNNSNEYAIGVYAPVYTKIPNNGYINISTNYPFNDDIYIDVGNLTSILYLNVRIPSWVISSNVVLTLNGIQQNGIINGTMHRLKIIKLNDVNKIYINFNPELRLYTTINDSISILRGSLLFSLPINGIYYEWDHYSFDSYDYQVYPNSQWNYALIINDTNNINKYFTINNHPFIPNHAPFNRTNIPIYINGSGLIVNTWNEYINAINTPPKSPVCNNITNNNCNHNIIPIKLVPHGCTDLRVASFPLAF